MESTSFTSGVKVCRGDITQKGTSRKKQSLPLPPFRWQVKKSGELGHIGIEAKCTEYGGRQAVEAEKMDYYDVTEDAAWREMGKWLEKCRGEIGGVEMLECLEREAIMGEDAGKDPTDYDRRARIFDKSSSVFQGLKESQAPT